MTRNLRRTEATEADTLKTISPCPKVGIDQMIDSWKTWRKIEKNTNTDCSPLSPPDVEPAPSHEQMGAPKGSQLDQRVRIHFHSKRRRLADPDGISCKAAIDGLVQGGILRDDSAKFVKEVSFSQEIAGDEETVIDITWD